MSFNQKEKYSKDMCAGDNSMKDPVHYANLKDFGKREIETFILFGKYFFPESTINKLEIDKSISLIDIGCGDKYLKYGCDEYNIDYVGIDFSDCNIEKEYLIILIIHLI